MNLCIKSKNTARLVLSSKLDPRQTNDPTAIISLTFHFRDPPPAFLKNRLLASTPSEKTISSKSVISPSSQLPDDLF
ncbi:hypothetical protein CEXT_815071 [Caerostris extrusa]|uniref:Uncharacterized protein n=1 Tax=Caerostris extrusa TaxID=172846 RepID=A0AAV4R7W6_CAEEX|nr:hypothetical protein CEXT_815071 [Caerostris extrusa]